MNRWCLGVFVALLAVGACLADPPAEPPKFYKLEFVVKEVDGSRVLNSRTYTTQAATDDSGCSIRAGSKVQTTVAQVEIGVNIDCRRLREVQGELLMQVISDLSTLVEQPGQSGPPVIRQNRWNSSVILPLRKPTVIFSSDDMTTKHQMQMELTATPIK